MAEDRARDFTFAALVATSAALNARRTALVDGDLRLSYDALLSRSATIAARLCALGVQPGDRIALLLPDGAAFIELVLAAARIGAIAVTLNWRLAPAEIAHILSDCAPRLIAVHPRYAGLVPADAPGQHLTVESRDVLAALPTAESASSGDPTGATPLYMMYTSGTTGFPKGCVHGQTGTAAAALALIARRGLTRDDRLLSTMPLFHVAGLGHALAMLAVGGTIIFAPRDADAAALCALAATERCSWASLNDGQTAAMRREIQARGGPMLHLRHNTRGAGFGNPAKIAWLRDEWACTVVGGYGQTEVGGYATFIDYADMLEHPTAIGWPVHHIRMTLLDADGQPLPDDWAGEGEIGIRSPSVMLGYWNKPEATAAALGTGWLRTGDLARRDALGLFHLTGRIKELIKSGGENVYPVEVEQVLAAHPAVLDAAIAGVPDRQWGEAVKAFIVPRAGKSVSSADLVRWCRERIAGYKIPRYVEFIDAIPRDHLGKTRRRELSDRPVTDGQRVERD